MTAYLLVYRQPNFLRFGTGPWSQETIASATVENAPGVEGVYSFFDNTLCILSKGTIRQLHDFVKERFPGLEFLIVEIGDLKAGSMHESFWRFLRENVSASAAE
jgi:hypothetical protein